MYAIVRWKPPREFPTTCSVTDRFFDESFLAAPQIWGQLMEGFSLAVDLFEEKGEYVVKAYLSGIEPEEIEVIVAGNVLTIKGETKIDREIAQNKYYVREQQYGSRMRQVSLPSQVDVDKVVATYEEGVLTVRLPKVEVAISRKITIHSSDTASTLPIRHSD